MKNLASDIPGEGAHKGCPYINYHVGAGLVPALARDLQIVGDDFNHRRSIRLDKYNYSQSGYYFVTIDVHDKLKLFWNEFKINEIGKLMSKLWINLSQQFEIELDEFVIMPDHMHGIIKILNNNKLNLGEIIGGFKSKTTLEYINGVKNNNWLRFRNTLWQRDYYERIVRNQNELNNIREYIINNPKKWIENIGK